MVTILVVRSIGEARYTRTLELPACPHVGDRLTVPGSRPLTVTRTVLHAREPEVWAPGFPAPRVEVELVGEPPDVLEVALTRGWKAVEGT